MLNSWRILLEWIWRTNKMQLTDKLSDHLIPMITCIWWGALADDNQSSTSVPLREIKSTSALQLANKIGYLLRSFLWAYPIVPASHRIAWYITQTFLSRKMKAYNIVPRKAHTKAFEKYGSFGEYSGKCLGKNPTDMSHDSDKYVQCSPAKVGFANLGLILQKYEMSN